jgi:hypothetical protein
MRAILATALAAMTLCAGAPASAHDFWIGEQVGPGFGYAYGPDYYGLGYYNYNYVPFHPWYRSAPTYVSIGPVYVIRPPHRVRHVTHRWKCPCAVGPRGW